MGWISTVHSGLTYLTYLWFTINNDIYYNGISLILWYIYYGTYIYMIYHLDGHWKNHLFHWYTSIVVYKYPNDYISIVVYNWYTSIVIYLSKWWLSQGGLLVSLSDHPLGSPMVQAWALSGGPGRPMRFARPRVRRQWLGMAPCPLAELGGPPVN